MIENVGLEIELDKIEIGENTTDNQEDYSNFAYGQRIFRLSEDQISALADGKAVYSTDGEYTYVIVKREETAV